MKVLGEKDAANVGGFEVVIKNRMARINDNYHRIYYVLGDNLSQNEDDAVATFGIPPRGSLRGRAVCVNQSAKELNRIRHPMTGAAAILWEVECEFDSDLKDDVTDSGTPPEDRLPKRRWYGETEEERLVRDVLTDKPIQTKAGEPIILMVPIICPILEVHGYAVGAFDPNVMLNYCNHTNKTVFYGAPVGCALMMPVETDEEWNDGRLITELTYKVKFKIKKNKAGALVADTWAYEVLHQGQQYLDTDGTVKRAEEKGSPIFVNLDSIGHILPPYNPLLPATEPVYLKWNRFHRAEFSDLNL